MSINKRSGNMDWLPGYFRDQDVFVVGSGPSLRYFDYSLLNRRNVISLNHASRFCPHKIALFIDAQFRREYPYDWYLHPQKVLAAVDTGLSPSGNVGVFSLTNEFRLDLEKGLLRATDKWSGVSGIHAAIIAGAERIFLLGMDNKFFSREEMLDVCEENGATNDQISEVVNMFSSRTKIAHSTSGIVDHYSDKDDFEYRFERAIRAFDCLSGKAEIINLSKHSALPYFPKMNYRDILKSEALTS